MLDWIMHLVGACPDCAGHPTIWMLLAGGGGALAAGRCRLRALWRRLRGGRP